jgi:flavin-dependent dehydrogenase
VQRHAEIAGGGIAGLNAAIVLARCGWSVRVHERAPEIRETGAGIFLPDALTRGLSTHNREWICEIRDGRPAPRTPSKPSNFISHCSGNAPAIRAVPATSIPV